MTLKKTERMNFTGESAQEIKRLQDNLSRAVDPITAVPLLDGVLIGPIALTTSFQPVAHGLGRSYLGWIVVRVDGSSSPYEDFTWAQQTISISMRVGSGTANAYLWVF